MTKDSIRMKDAAAAERVKKCALPATSPSGKIVRFGIIIVMDATPASLIVQQKQFNLKRRRRIKSLAQSYPKYCVFPKSVSVIIIR